MSWRTTEIDGCDVECSATGVLIVRTPVGGMVSVLPIGTHAALDVLGAATKRKIVRWWKEQRA